MLISQNITSFYPILAAEIIVPNVQPGSNFDINFFLAVVIIVCGAIYTIIQLFGPSTSVKDETLRKSPYLDDMKKNINDAISSTDKKVNEIKDDIIKKIEKVKEDVTKGKDETDKIKDEIHRIKIECNNVLNASNNNGKSLEEIKTENKKFVEKIDGILNEILDLLD